MKILIIEDEIKLAKALKSGLEQDGYAVDSVHDFEDGLAYATTEEYDFMIIDRMLPGGKDGINISKIVRESGIYTPIILLTALGQSEDIVSGLDSGADDYLTKPFKFEELLARLRALKRRPVQVNPAIIKLDNLEIDMTSKLVRRIGGQSPDEAKDSVEIRLSKKEYAVLEYLAHNLSNISSKEQILSHVWDFDADVLPNSVEVAVKAIRKKIDQPGKQSHIETVRGFGYRLRTANV